MSRRREPPPPPPPSRIRLVDVLLLAFALLMIPAAFALAYLAQHLHGGP